MKPLILAVAASLLLASGAQAQCGPDRYVNVSGHCVHRPVHSSHIPPRASARCVDGTYSYSEHRRGTCSHHGGVATWL
jgi:Protein of unknown function (DUF3761)